MANVKKHILSLKWLIIAFLFRGKAPIASMDAMEDMDLLSGSNTHLSKLSR